MSNFSNEMSNIKNGYGFDLMGIWAFETVACLLPIFGTCKNQIQQLKIRWVQYLNQFLFGKYKQQNMKALVYIALLVLTMSSIIKEPEAKSNGLVGTTSTPKPVKQAQLDAELSKINLFIRKNVPEVKGLKLYSIRTQVVAGIKYFCTYDSATRPGTKKLEIIVWSKPYENNFLEVTRPNGTIIQKGGYSKPKANTRN